MSGNLPPSPKRVLGERSPNTSSPAKSQDVSDIKHMNTFSRPIMTEVKESQEHTYVSPSDNILSPTSKKLNEIKGKRFGNVKARSLFAKTVAKEGLKNQEKLNQTDKK